MAICQLPLLVSLGAQNSTLTVTVTLTLVASSTCPGAALPVPSPQWNLNIAETAPYTAVTRGERFVFERQSAETTASTARVVMVWVKHGV